MKVAVKVSDLFKKHCRLILPFLLTVVLSLSLYSIYMIQFFSLWTLAIIGVTAAVFALCEFVNKHHFIGGIIFTITVFAALRLFIGLVFGVDYGESFQRWFLTGSEQVSTKFEYLLALLISLIPFFGVAVYYFSNVLYRMSFLTLVSLIPCAVYVKVLSEIDNVFICLIAILNVAVLMMNIRTEQGKNCRVIGQRASVLSACVFAFVLLVVSTAVPKEQDARYYDRFEELFMDSNFTVKIDENYSLFSDISGNADSYRNFSNRRMYTLYGENVPYFKRQTFDCYDFELDAWTYLSYCSEPVYSYGMWEDMVSGLNLGNLRLAVIRAEELREGFIRRYGLERLAEYENFTDEVKEVFVQCEDFGALYFLSPARVTGVEPFDRWNTPDRFVTRGGVVRTRRNMHPKNLGYRVIYYDEFKSRNLWFELGGADFDNEKAGDMLEELEEILTEGGDPLSDTAAGFLRQHKEAEYYRGLTEDNCELIPESICTLAEEITQGLSYDWERALALQNYFFNNNFVYDLKYTARDTSPEYFLFNSKRGSCSDFASAYVLMARSVGLTVRYAEGYSPDITSREGVFVIKDSCSHAYPEVYIQNMGWVVFEPTVPSDYNDMIDDAGAGGNVAIDFDLVLVMCVMGASILAIAMSAVILYPLVVERAFIRRAVIEEPGKCASMLYSRIITHVVPKIIRHGESLTPFETRCRLMEMTGLDIDILTASVERSAYGGERIEGDNGAFKEMFLRTKAAVRNFLRDKNRQDRQAARDRHRCARERRRAERK